MIIEIKILKNGPQTGEMTEGSISRAGLRSFGKPICSKIKPLGLMRAVERIFLPP